MVKKSKTNYLLYFIFCFYILCLGFGLAFKYLGESNSFSSYFKQISLYQVIMNSPFILTSKLLTLFIDYRIVYFILFFIGVMISTYIFKLGSIFFKRFMKSYKYIISVARDKELPQEEHIDKIFDELEGNKITFSRFISAFFGTFFYFNMITYFFSTALSGHMLIYLNTGSLDCYLFSLETGTDTYHVFFIACMCLLLLPQLINFIKFYLSKENKNLLKEGYVSNEEYLRKRTLVNYKTLVTIAGTMFLVIPSYQSVIFTTFILISRLISFINRRIVYVQNQRLQLSTN